MSAMTKVERDQLASIIKGRRQVAKRVVEQRAAELLADVEAQLAKRYSFGHSAWADLTAIAQRAVADANRELAHAGAQAMTGDRKPKAAVPKAIIAKLDTRAAAPPERHHRLARRYHRRARRQGRRTPKAG